MLKMLLLSYSASEVYLVDPSARSINTSERKSNFGASFPPQDSVELYFSSFLSFANFCSQVLSLFGSRIPTFSLPVFEDSHSLFYKEWYKRVSVKNGSSARKISGQYLACQPDAVSSCFQFHIISKCGLSE